MKSFLGILLMGVFATSLFAGDTKEVVFWKWFQKNEERLFSFEKDQEKTFDDLAAALNKVNTDLTFEFSPVRPEGRREFVISAGGIKAAFPTVESLFAAAPTMKRWIFVKFRPRRNPINDLEYAGRKVRAQDVHFLLFKDENPEKAGIMIFLDGYREEEKKTLWGHIGYLFLDETLGEYDVETKVGAIVFHSRESKYFTRANPIAELPQAFDAHFQK